MGMPGVYPSIRIVLAMAPLLDTYLEKWSLQSPKLLAQTATSNVFTVYLDGEMVVLKLLTPLGVADEQEGAAALRYFDGHGAVRLLAADSDAHLLEYAGDNNLATMVRRGDDEQATHITAQVLNRLHSTYNGPQPKDLKPLQRWFQGLFQRAARDREADTRSLYVEAAEVVEHLLSTAHDETVLHGDIHHENIRLHPTRGWLAYDPKGLWGERLFDVCNTVWNPPGMRDLVLQECRLLKNMRILATECDCDYNRLLQFIFAYGCLSAAWTEEDGADAHDSLRIAGIVRRHLA